MLVAISIAFTVSLALAVFFYCAVRLSKRLRRAKAKRIIDFLPYANNEQLRAEAIVELAQLDVDVGITRVIEALHNGGPAVCEATLPLLLRAAKNTLLTMDKLCPKNVTESFLANLANKIVYARLMRGLERHLVPVVIAVLNEADGDLREAALDALREIGTPAALEAVSETRSATISESTQFAAHYAREMTPNNWQPLIAYVYRTAARDAVAMDVQSWLPTWPSPMRESIARTTVPVPQGAVITATLQLDGFDTNPPVQINRR